MANWLDEQLSHAVKEYETWPQWMKDCSRTGEFIRGTKTMTTDNAAQMPDKNAERYSIAYDGFVGTVIGRYVTKEGKRGVVMQQDGSQVVHVYGEKHLLPVVAENAHTADDGWIEWRGGVGPVAPGEIIEARQRNGRLFKTGDENIRWSHNLWESDITAYRVVEPANETIGLSDAMYSLGPVETIPCLNPENKHSTVDNLAAVEAALHLACVRVSCTEEADIVEEALRSLATLREQMRPVEGWQLVPTKHDGKAGLTHAMCHAFWKAFYTALNQSGRGEFESTNAGYNAMLAVAPQLAAAQDAGEGV